MKKLMLLAALLLMAAPALAVVNVSTAVTSMVTSPATLNAGSTLGLFSFGLSQDAGETLSSVSVNIVNESGSSASSSDFASVKVLKGTAFGTATEIGSNPAVNVGSLTTVSINSGSNAISSSDKYFVTLSTGSSWAQPDKVKVTMPANAILTSANSPVLTAVTTAALSAPLVDTTGPVLTSVVAFNKAGSSSGLEAGDYVVVTFGEATNKPVIDSTNVNNIFALNNGHSWRDGVNSIGGSSWNQEGTALTLTLSSGNSLPSISVGDSVTVAGTVIKDAMGNNASGSASVSGSFSPANTAGPILQSVVAFNKTNGTDAKEAGDIVKLTFNEPTNRAAIHAGNIDTVFALNNSHSWKDGVGAIGSALWDTEGKVLTVTISGGTSVPTVAVGDTVTVSGGVIKDSIFDGIAMNATGSLAVTGSFGTATFGGNEYDFGKDCNGGLIKNGRLYKIEGSDTVYLAASCRLKPFRGAAVFKARGHKFQDIKVLTTAQAASLTISDKPVLPAGGTLIKGTKATVWFVTEDGKLKGFVSEKAFKRLGFDLRSVKAISDSDLSEMPITSNIEEFSAHPEGTVLKCSVNATVYMIKGDKKYAFTNPQPYLERGHTWDSVATVDCKQFQYPAGPDIAD